MVLKKIIYIATVVIYLLGTVCGILFSQTSIASLPTQMNYVIVLVGISNIYIIVSIVIIGFGWIKNKCLIGKYCVVSLIGYIALQIVQFIVYAYNILLMHDLGPDTKMVFANMLISSNGIVPELVILSIILQLLLQIINDSKPSSKGI